MIMIAITITLNLPKPPKWSKWKTECVWMAGEGRRASPHGDRGADRVVSLRWDSASIVSSPNLTSLSDFESTYGQDLSSNPSWQKYLWWDYCSFVPIRNLKIHPLSQISSHDLWAEICQVRLHTSCQTLWNLTWKNYRCIWNQIKSDKTQNLTIDLVQKSTSRKL